MSEPPGKTMDPRVRRTRQLLHDALERLLETKDFEGISIQEITDAATLSRATFYDHYSDKTSLLKCVVALRFQALLEARGVRFDGSCGSALAAIALGVCDYLAGLPGTSLGRPRSLDPHLESAVITVIRGLILDGLKQHASRAVIPLEMIAATLSWGMYGGAREWSEAPERLSSEQAAAAIAALLHPIFSTLTAGAQEPAVARDMGRSD